MLKKFNLHSQQKRILALILLVSFIFCVLLIRLGVVQLIDGAWLQSKAQDQWTRDLPLKAERGKIYDSTGSSLAVSYTTYNIYTRAREIENPKETATYLSNLLGLTYQSVYNKVTNKNQSEFLIKMQVEEELARDIIDKNIKGVYLSQNTKRYYPYGDLLTQILGFTTIDNIGQAGIELYYNDLLKGTDGKSLVQADITGQELENTLSYYIPSIPGCDITLTIDAKIQLIVEQALNKVMEEQQAKSTTAIIMKANTGEIVAMSTKPSFDLNDVPRNDPSVLLENVKNKAVVDVYEPGSTFKILTMAATLEENTANDNSRFYCGGSTTVDGERIKCWRSIGHGSQTLSEGLANSCNCVFVDLALRLGTDTFYNYFSAFGLGQKTGIEISGESAGIIMNKDSAKRVDLARMGFGQAIAVTPLQLITAVCSAVNGGTLYEPYLIKQIVSPDGKIIEENYATPVRQVVSASTSKTLNAMLEGVVSKTGKYTFVPGYEIGGKTGTSQKYENGSIARGKYVSSFIGTYPASNPEYVLLLLVDEPGTGAYYGSVVASPYAKEIFSGMFEYLNIEPDDPTLASAEVATVTMPDLINKTLTEAVTTLVSLGLNYEIDGEGLTITNQLPPAGTKVKVTDTVVICAG